MGLVEIIILAVVQGLTEFLPVSSSGHLVVVSSLLVTLGYDPPSDLIEVNIALHVATLAAVILYFWREIWQLFGRDRRLIPLLIVGTIPAAVIGVPLKLFAESVLESPMLAGWMFLVTAVLLIWASRLKVGTASYRYLSYPAAIKIGLLQAVALLPGVSRSGATIAGGLACGLDRRSAGTFAFLLAIPAIAGAGCFETLELWQAAGGEASAASETAAVSTSPGTLAIGAVVAMVVGLGALSWLIRWVQQGRLALFAWYLIPLGVAVIWYQWALNGYQFPLP